MSQVDDWSDGYTSDYLRDLNTYGPASANVPRSSVVSHQVRYRAPDTSDIPLAPGQNPEDSVYSNASGARMGQLKSRSGYNPPAGGGYTAETFPSSGGSGRRYARPKKSVKRQTQSVKRQTQSVKRQTQSVKNQAQNYGSYGSPEPKPPVESVVSRAQDITDQSDMYRAIAGLSSPPSANDSQSEVRTTGRSDIDLSGLPRERSDMTPLPGDNWSPVDKAGAGINPFESDESLAAWKDLKLKSFPILPSEMAGGVPADAVTRFRQIAADPNSTVADVLSAENEAKRAAIDEGMTMDDIAAFEKEVALNLLFAGAGSAVNALRGVGGAARAASSTGNVWVEGSRAAAGDATAGAKAFEEALSRMNGGAVRGAPVEGTARRSFSSAAEGRRLYGSVVERLLAPKGPLTGGARTTLTSADEGLPVGYSILRNPKIDASPLAGQTSSLAQQLRAAGIPEDQIAASIARINAGAAGREAAAAGREAVAAGEQAAGREAAAAGREAAGALASQLQKDLLAVRQKVSSEGDSFERIRDVLRTSAGRQELLPANIREACEPLRRIMEQGGGAALTPAEREAVQLYMSRSAASGAAGAAGREAATGAGRSGEAAGAAARQGEGKATGTLSAYDRQQYRNYINMVRNDPDLVDLVPLTLNRVVGRAGRSIDSLSDAELSEFYSALNDAVNERWVADIFRGQQ